MSARRRVRHGDTIISTGGGSGTAGNLIVGPDYGSTGQHAIALAMTMPEASFGFSRSMSVAPTMPEVQFAMSAQTVTTALAGSYLGAPNWLSVGTVDGTNAGLSVVIPKPAGLAVGDLMLAFIGSTQLKTCTQPSGWTQILNTQRDGVLLDVTLNSSWKIAEAADVAASDFTFTLSGGGNPSFWGCIHRISAFDTSTPVNVSAGGGGSAADPVAPTATTTANNCLIFVACVQANATNITYTAPATYTERTDQNMTSTGGTVHSGDGSTATKILGTAGATGTSTFNSTGISAAEYAAQTVCIATGALTL